MSPCARISKVLCQMMIGYLLLIIAHSPFGLVNSRNSGEPSFSVTRAIESSRRTNVPGSASIWFLLLWVRDPRVLLRCMSWNLSLKPNMTCLHINPAWDQWQKRDQTYCASTSLSSRSRSWPSSSRKAWRFLLMASSCKCLLRAHWVWK